MITGIPIALSHRNGCDCALLADAIGIGADAVSFEFCLRVLQKHWRLRCNHGCVRPVGVRPVERWSGLGRVDQVQALLICSAKED